MLKRVISILLLTLVVAVAYALPVECISKATQVENGNDTLFIFKENIELGSTIGNVDWYSTSGELVASNTEQIYPDEGGYYIVKGDVEYSPFYVFVCKGADFTMSAEASCENTILRLTGDTKPYTYTRRNGTTGHYARACTIDYNALVWQNEAWEDSAAQMNVSLAEAISMPQLYGKTPITLCVDAELRDKLNLDTASVSMDFKEEDVRAVNLHLTSLAMSREDDPDGNNEQKRPNSQDIIKATVGTDYSGPLEVVFYSNPTPAAKYYQWTIYHAAEQIVSRNDTEIRYTFSVPGSYRVVCRVNNEYCVSDSMEMAVAISESFLAVPNVFTPNGDHHNDEFRVSYRSIKEFHCWVYNRWGHLVYEWTDPAKGWDGTIGGRPAAEGAYFYVIRALGTDAPKNASYMMKAAYNKKKISADESVIGVYQMSGDINLLR